eukprot:g3771.t1
MGGGASKTKTEAVQHVDRVVVVGGTIIYSAALPADGTLRDARETIVADRDDPDDPLVGVPQDFRFVAESGGRIAKRSEADRLIRDSLTDGETLVLVDADAGDTSGANKAVKEGAGRPAATVTMSIASAAADLGEKAEAIQEGIDAAEEAVDAAKSFASDMNLEDMMGSAFGIADSLADAVPGARAVLKLLVSIHEKFKAQRELSENITVALNFVAEVAKHIASAVATSLKHDIDWQPLTRALRALQENIDGIKSRSSARSRLGKFRAWLKATSDQEALDVCIADVREAMKDLNFGMNVQLVHKVDAVGAQLRADVLGLQGGIKALLGEEFAGLREKLQAHLGMDATALQDELQQVEANQQTMLKNQDDMRGDLGRVLANQERLMRGKDEETLEEVLDPLRDLDDAVIDDNMRRFAEGTRLWAFKAFDEWVKSGFATHRVFVLTAGAGVGKTGIMCKLVRDRPDVVAAYHFCRHDDPGRRGNPKRMLMSLAYQLSQRLPAYRAELEA